MNLVTYLLTGKLLICYSQSFPYGRPENQPLLLQTSHFERWDEIFGDAAITSTIVDRLTYKAKLGLK